MVPRTFTETRQVPCTEFVPETRTRTFTVNRPVTETHPVQREYTEMVPQTRTRSETYMVSVPTFREENRPYTVMVPEQVTRQATQAVCQWVPTTVNQTVCRDNGHWEDRPIASNCSSCGGEGTAIPYTVGYGGADLACGGACAQPCQSCAAPCAPQTARVWVPNIVQEQVPTTVMRQQTVNVPYQYTETIMRPETRQQTIRVCEYRNEQRTRQVNYVEMVPTRRTFTEQITTCRLVPEQRNEQYTVMVPRQTQREIQVQVCRLVPETITIQQPALAALPCNTCGFYR